MRPIKGATSTGDDEDEDDLAMIEDDPLASRAGGAQEAAWPPPRRRSRRWRQEFVAKLAAARADLSPDDDRELVLRIATDRTSPTSCDAM